MTRGGPRVRGTERREGEGVSGKRRRRGTPAGPEGGAGWGRTELAPEALAVCAFEVSCLVCARVARRAKPPWAAQR